MGWRVSGNLKVITNDIKARRKNATVYSIGDVKHMARTSDHNIDSRGIVCAIDVMIRNGFTDADARLLIKSILGRSDLQYIIYRGKIASASWGWTWKKYNGSDQHFDHVHVSSKHTTSADRCSKHVTWGSNDSPGMVKPVVGKPTPSISSPFPGLLKRGSKGAAVKTLQTRLNQLKVGGGVGTADGDFGPKTLAAVRRWQIDHKLTVDGLVGKQTWDSLFATTVHV